MQLMYSECIVHSAHAVRPHAQWDKMTVKILNCDTTFCLGAIGRVSEQGKHRRFSTKYHILVPYKYKDTVKCIMQIMLDHTIPLSVTVNYAE